MTNKWAIGVDLGGTKIEVACVDAMGTIREKERFPTRVHGDPDAVEEAIVAAAKELCKKIASPPAGLGIGAAAQVSPHDGSVIFAPNLEWKNVPLQSNLSKALNLPVVVLNDVRAATWGEWLHGAGQGYDQLACLFIGTGIGGGVVVNGEVLSGCSNTAGELGHLIVDLDGPPCTCGGVGCMEAIAGGLSIARHARTAMQQNPKLGQTIIELAKGGEITTRVIIDAYRTKDPLAESLIRNATDALIAGCASIINAFNPCLLILGGGVMEGLPELAKEIDKGVRKYALPAALADFEVRLAKLRNEAGTIGAASLALREFG